MSVTEMLCYAYKTLTDDKRCLICDNTLEYCHCCDKGYDHWLANLTDKDVDIIVKKVEQVKGIFFVYSQYLTSMGAALRCLRRALEFPAAAPTFS